jgi:anti-sigma factor RsiW
MNCRHIKNKLLSYQEGNLATAEQLDIAEHLKLCSACSQEKADLDASWEILSEVEKVESAPFFWTRLSRRISELDKPLRTTFPNPRRWLTSPLFAVTVLIIAFLTGFYFGKTISFQATLSQQAKMEQDVYEIFSNNELDVYSIESISEAYVSLISENSN